MVKSSYLNFRKDGKICEKTNKKQNNIEIWLREVQWRCYMYEDIENKILFFSQRTAKPFKGICISIGAIILCLVEWHGFWTPCLDIIVIKEGLQSLCWFFLCFGKVVCCYDYERSDKNMHEGGVNSIFFTSPI